MVCMTGMEIDELAGYIEKQFKDHYQFTNARDAVEEAHRIAEGLATGAMALDDLERNYPQILRYLEREHESYVNLMGEDHDPLEAETRVPTVDPAQAQQGGRLAGRDLEDEAESNLEPAGDLEPHETLERDFDRKR